MARYFFKYTHHKRPHALLDKLLKNNNSPAREEIQQHPTGQLRTRIIRTRKGKTIPYNKHFPF